MPQSEISHHHLVSRPQRQMGSSLPSHLPIVLQAGETIPCLCTSTLFLHLLDPPIKHEDQNLDLERKVIYLRVGEFFQKFLIFHSYTSGERWTKRHSSQGTEGGSFLFP